MSQKKADIIAQLQRDILPLQGLKPTANGDSVDVGLGHLNHAFSGCSFPIGAIHEFCCLKSEDMAAATGYVAGLLASLMRGGGAIVWITSNKTLFPPALSLFGIEPDKIIFVYLQKEKDILWAMEEALRCNGLAAVVGEMQELSFTSSRRLQLAVEQSRVTGFIIRRNPRIFNTTACVSRWMITQLPSVLEDNIPGVGFPRWNVELLKIRNGKPGSWQIEWVAGRFRHIPIITSMPLEQRKKTG